ncbi:MAG: hypothetical protein ACHQFZ_07090 [Acidimicrobiales bacterium]
MEALEDATAEHVFARSIGGYGFVVPAHRGCNELANRLIDGRLGLCSHVTAARAALGVVDPRTGDPYRHELFGETIMSAQVGDDDATSLDADSSFAQSSLLASDGLEGAKVQFRLGKGPMEMRFVGNPVVGPGGLRRRCVSANPDHVMGERGGSTDRFIALVNAKSKCVHGPKLWGRLASKVGLGMLHLLSDMKVSGEDPYITDTIDWNPADRARHLLIDLAFGTSPPLQDEAIMFQGFTELQPTHLAAIKTAAHETQFCVALFGHLGALVSVPETVISAGPGIDFSVPVVSDGGADPELPEWWSFRKLSAQMAG